MMFLLKSTAAILIVLMTATDAHSAFSSSIYDPYSNANLDIVGSNSSSWTQAEAQAQALGGNLITIHSAAEDAFVANTIFQNFASQGGPNLSNLYAIWTGLYDPTGIAGNDGHSTQHAANFTWVDGETPTYRNWNTGEPNNGFFLGQGPNEYYSSMYGPDATPLNVGNGGSAAPTGTWNDLPNSYAITQLGTTGFYGIAAVPVPEPASSGALMLAIVVATGFWARNTKSFAAAADSQVI